MPSRSTVWAPLIRPCVSNICFLRRTLGQCNCHFRLQRHCVTSNHLRIDHLKTTSAATGNVCPSENFCWEAEQYARTETGVPPEHCPPEVQRLPSPSHASGSVTPNPEKAGDIQSLVAAAGMVVKSGMPNTYLRSMSSAVGIT